MHSYCTNLMGFFYAMTKPTTQWKPVVGYEGLYEISENGEVKKTYDSKNQYQIGYILNPSINRNGYLQLWLYKNGIRKNHNIHRLVALSFIENTHNKPCINHKDGNKLNNNISNLEWCTYSENNRHAHLLGLNKITEHNIICINAMVKANKKQVLDLYTGIYYDSLKEATNFTNVNYNTAHTQILRNSKNQRFKYI